MTRTFSTALVTGGYGFIGSHLTRLLASRVEQLWNIDSGTYAASPARVADVDSNVLVSINLDVREADRLHAFIRDNRPDVVVHLAAETHVTRSEDAEELFFSSNVEGTRSVLRACAETGCLLLHVSTDEVYGPAHVGFFKESDKEPGAGLASSAYARSKAVAEEIVLEAAGSQPVIVVRPTNCYGPWQHPEKAIPRWICRGLDGSEIPVWGDGRQVRDWMFVEDACAGMFCLLDSGKLGEVYNLGPGESRHTNLEIATQVAEICGVGRDGVVLTDYDRPQHDRRYAIDASKIRSLDWGPQHELRKGLTETVAWFRDHRDWWEPLLERSEGIYQDVPKAR